MGQEGNSGKDTWETPMINSIVYFILVLGLLIFVHELGHFLVARLFGVGVETFSLGYGSRLFGKKIGRTDYRVSLLPLGGYCKMVGEEPGEEIEPENIPLSFTHQHVLKRIPIIAAGPIFNIVLSVLLLFGLFQISGLMVFKSSVGSVTPGSPAEASGMKAGDLILAIDEVSVSSWDEMTQIIADGGDRSLSFAIRRGEEILVKTITPESVTSKNIFGEDVERRMIGIGIGDETFTRELSFVEAFFLSIERTYFISKLTVLTVVKVVQGDISAKTIGGPIMIAEMAGQTAKAGIGSLVFFVALISINLAILNLLPIPVLDGGHLMFFFIELIIRRPVSVRIREIAQQAGMFVLLLLMIYVFYNDITRIFSD